MTEAWIQRILTHDDDIRHRLKRDAANANGLRAWNT